MPDAVATLNPPATAAAPAPPRSYLAMVGMRLLGQSAAVVGLVWIGLVAFFAIFAPFIANSSPLLWRTKAGQWSSPLIANLDAVDVILLLMTFAAVALCLARRWPFGRRLAAFTWVLAAMLPAASWAQYLQAWPGEAARWGGAIAISFTGVLCAILLVTLIWIPLRSKATLRQKLAVGLPTLALAIVVAWFPPLPPRLISFDHYRQMEAAGQASYVLDAPIPYSPTDRFRDSLIDTRMIGPGFAPTPAAIRKAVADAAGNDLPGNAANDKKLVEAMVKDAFAKAKQLKPGVTPEDLGPAIPDVAHQLADARMIRIASVQPNTQLHLMGTTSYGEDLASRMIHACRIAMSIGFIATGIALIIGIGLGGLMGYFSGWMDLWGMRLVEVFNAIPTLFLLIAFVAFYGRNLYLIMVIIGLTGWVGYALFVRAEFLRLREQDFVQAAKAAGLPLRSILFRHMLPNGIAPVLVTASFGIASAILAEATLSFIGLGLVDQPSWGQMLNEARGVGASFYWWLALYPGLAIFLTVFAYNLVGEALRDAIDPHVS